MTDIEKLFLFAYPLWPSQLLDKFASLLTFELSKFNKNLNAEVINAHENMPKMFFENVTPYEKSVNRMLNPSNERYVKSLYYGPIGRQLIHERRPLISSQLPEHYKRFTNADFFGKIEYDERLFDSVSISDVVIDYRVVSTNASFFNTPYYTIEILENNPKLVINANVSKYDGARTALAMSENGVYVTDENNLLKEFVIFLNAYSKYEFELLASSNLTKAKNEQIIVDEKQKFAEKINSRRIDINDFKTSIAFAAQNETRSAKRDMQNLALSLQSLMMQLKSKLASDT